MSRPSPKDRPVCKDKSMALTHDRAEPVIAIVFELEPVTEDILKLYRVDASQVKLE